MSIRATSVMILASSVFLMGCGTVDYGDDVATAEQSATAAEMDAAVPPGETSPEPQLGAGPVLGTASADLSTDEGYAVNVTLTVHEPQLYDPAFDLPSLCGGTFTQEQLEAKGDTVYVQYVEGTATDITPGGFTNPLTAAWNMDNSEMLVQSGCTQNRSDTRLTMELGTTETLVLYWVGYKTPELPDGDFSGTSTPWDFMSYKPALYNGIGIETSDCESGPADGGLVLATGIAQDLCEFEPA